MNVLQRLAVSLQPLIRRNLRYASILSTNAQKRSYYIIEMIDKEIESHVREGSLKESIKVLMSGIAEMQDEISRIASKQNRTVTAFMGVLEQIDKEQGRKPSADAKERAQKRVTIETPSTTTSYGPDSATRLNNAGLGPDGPVGSSQESISSYQNHPTQGNSRDTSRLRSTMDTETKSASTLSDGHLPLNYYVSDIDSMSASKGSRFGLGTDLRANEEAGANWLRKMIHDRVEQTFAEVPVFKQLKLEQPERYEGKDDMESFESWTSSICRWMRLAGLTGPKFDKERVIVLGQILSGQALIWYNSVIDSSDRVEQDWTFQAAMVA